VELLRICQIILSAVNEFLKVVHFLTFAIRDDPLDLETQVLEKFDDVQVLLM